MDDQSPDEKNLNQESFTEEKKERDSGAMAVADTLKGYGIGRKVRALRLRKKLGLVQLAKHTGFSPALLSKIETGKLYPPLGTLTRIAMVFGVGLDYFFRDSKRPVVSLVRAGERERLPSNPDGSAVSYVFESLDFRVTERKMNAWLAEFIEPSDGVVTRHAHDGYEFVHLLSGTLLMKIGDEEVELAAGDSIYFDSSFDHDYRRAGDEETKGIVITVPA